MTQRKSSSRLNRLIYAEGFGTIISLTMLVYMSLNFHRLDDWLTISGGIFLLLIIGLGLIMTFFLIKKIRKINIVENSYHQTLTDFNDLKKLLHLYKRVSILLNIITPFIVLPVVYKLFLGKDLLLNLDEYWKGVLASFILIPIMLYFLFRFYKQNIRKVSETLNNYASKEEEQ